MVFLPGFKTLTCRHRGHGPHDHPHYGGNGASGVEKEIRRREITVGRRLLDVNEERAEENRRLFADHEVFVAARRIFDMAGVTYRQLHPEHTDINLHLD